MAGSKARPAGKKGKKKMTKPSKPKAAKKMAVKKMVIEKRTARDVQFGPPSKSVSLVFEKGSRETLSSFRNKVGW